MDEAELALQRHWRSPESQKVQNYLKRARGYDRDDWRRIEDARFLDMYVAPRYRDKSVLDFGAGPGRLVPMWTSHGAQLKSTDWSESFLPALIDISSRHGARAEALDITAGALNEQFDLVFSTQVMLHIHPRHLDAAMANIRRMARGEIVLVTWQDSRPFDGHDSTKRDSFNHDYRALFERHRCSLLLELDLVFRALSSRPEVRNRIYVLAPN